MLFPVPFDSEVDIYCKRRQHVFICAKMDILVKASDIIVQYSCLALFGKPDFPTFIAIPLSALGLTTRSLNRKPTHALFAD